MILLAVPALHVPGRSVTVAAIIALLIAAGLVLVVRRPEQRPPLTDALAVLPVALLVLVPFAASGRAGTLGVSVNNDMGAHMLLAEAYRSQAISHISPLLPDYPLGAHALVAALVEGLGIRTDLAFAGLTAAAPVLLACSVLAALQRVPWMGRILGATVVGMPFLIAGFYSEGSFKELFEALFVLASVLILSGAQPEIGMRRWIPLALVMAGAVSVYSVQGLVWPVIFLGAWLLGRMGARAWRSGVRPAWLELRSELAPGAIGLGVLVLVLVPQIPRVEKFISKSSNNNIPKTNLGNLVGPLPGWEAFGVWSNPDFRMPPPIAFTAGMWTAFVLALVILGVVWLLYRKQWILPAAAGLAMLVWVYSNDTQSPYIAAKALAVASPLLLLLAVMPLVQRTRALPTWWRLLAPVLAVVLLVRVLDSSWQALRNSKVGPTDHLVELRSLRAEVGNKPTLFLGDDDFIRWELAGTRVTPAYINRSPDVPLRPQKAFSFGQALDFDSVEASTLNEFDWVITTRDAAGSAPPAQIRLARLTRSYALWKRVGVVEPREILNEGQSAAGLLDCGTLSGRALARRSGVAAVRAPAAEVAVPPLAPGTRTTVILRLAPGSWELETPYISPLPLEVSAVNLRTTLPANLDLPGPRWPIGRIVVSGTQPVPVTFHASKYWLTPKSDVAVPTSVIATPVGAERLVPLSDACGRLVDWYRIS